MSQINVRNLSNENEDGAPNIVGVSTFSATSYFVPPVGNTQQRPDNPQPGDLRFNTDTASLEYFKGNTIGWSQVEMTSSDLGGGTGSNTGTGARGLFGLGFISPTGTNQINFVTIPSLGNAQDFGDLTAATRHFGCASSRTRGLFMHGANVTGPAEVNIIDYVTISSVANAVDFGDSTGAHRQRAGVSNQTRAVFGGGYVEASSPYVKDVVEYVTIAQTGNAVDFGNLSNASRVTSSVSSSTRGVFGLAYPGNGNIIEYVTIATTGNTTDFGDRTAKSDWPTATSNSTRGVFAGGDLSGDSANNVIDYITIATTGNAVDFGDLASRRTRFVGATSSPTRGLFAGGNSPSTDNVIQYVEILTTGNATDFGDLTSAASFGSTGGTLSNAHGGL